MDALPKLNDPDVEYVQTIHPHLVGVDGCDGVGKTTLADSLRRIMPMYTSDEIIVIEPNLFEGSTTALVLGEAFQRLRTQLTDEDINNYFLAACQANYEEIVLPALRRGGWVILISSDLRALAFTLAERSASIAEYTREVVRRGTLTRGFQPKYRCMLEAEPNALLQRVQGRGSSDAFDPATLQGYKRRIASLEEAVLYMQRLVPDTLWRRMTLATVGTEQITAYMDTVAYELAQWITEEA